MYDFFRFALITVLAAVGAGTSNAGHASSALAGHVLIRSPLNAAEQSAPSSAPSSSAPSSAAKPSSAKSEAPKLDAALAAEFAAADKRPEDAARLYLDAAKAENRGDFAERAVRLALSARNFGLAETAAALWVKVAPNNLNALQAQAFAMIAQGKKDDALEKVRTLLLADNDDAASLTMGLLAAPDARGLAVELLQELKAEPKLLALPIDRGLVPLCLRLKQNELALELATKNTEADPKNSKAWLWRALAEVAMSEGKAAASSYEKALALDPKNVRLRLSYVQVLNDLKRVDDIEKVLRAAPEATEEIYQARMAFALSDSGKSNARSKRALKQLAKEIENARGLDLAARQTLLGQIFELRDEPKRAMQWYGAVSKGERWPNAQLRLAVLQSESNDQAAFKTLQALQNSDAPDQAIADAFMLEADLLAKAKQLEKAGDALTRGLDRLPEDANILYARAMNAFARDDLAGLETDLKTIIAADPQNAQALNALGYSLLDKTDRLDEATDYIQQAYYLEPKSVAIMDSLGWAYFKRGQYDQAIVQLRAAYEAEPEGEIAAHLIEALWTLGAEEEAREIWLEALKKFPDSEPLKSTVERLTQKKTEPKP